MFKRSPRPGWVAIDVQPRSVRAVHVVRREGARPSATLRAIDREGEEREDLQRARKTIGMTGVRCTTALDIGAYHVVQLPAPAVPAAEAREALRWALKDSIDFPPDDAVVDAMPVPADATRAGRPAQIIAVAARRDRVRARMQSFDDAGVELAAIDVAEVAQRNLGALYEQPDRGLAFLRIGDHGGVLTFTRNGELYTLRRIDVTAGALAARSADARRDLIERLTLELQRSLDNFDRQFSHVALQRLAIAPFAGRDALVAELQDMLSVPVQAADLTTAIEVDADPGVALADEATQADWVVPIGLALRSQDAA